MPSIYFDDEINELYLCGGEIGYLESEEGLISLRENDDYPHEVKNWERTVISYEPVRSEYRDLYNALEEFHASLTKGLHIEEKKVEVKLDMK